MTVVDSPFADGGKVIVIDEEIKALCARTLIAGWIQKWKLDVHPLSIELFTFSQPKSYYLEGPAPFTADNITVHDFYTKDINNGLSDDVEKLMYLLKSIELKNLVSKNSITIIDDLSSLVIFAGVAKASRFIEKLAKHVPRLICIYQKDFVQHQIPHIETLGTVYVRLEKFNGSRVNNNFIYVARTTTRKSEKSVQHESLLVMQDIETYDIKVTKLLAETNKKINNDSSNNSDKIESSFRIGVNEREMEQKMKTPLPYAFDNKTNTSKILYVPEDIDDLDEEDPDDDLCF